MAMYPHYDYLADIQDSLLEMDGKYEYRESWYIFTWSIPRI